MKYPKIEHYVILITMAGMFIAQFGIVAYAIADILGIDIIEYIRAVIITGILIMLTSIWIPITGIGSMIKEHLDKSAHAKGNYQ